MTKPYTYRAADPQPGGTPVLGAWHSRPAFHVPVGSCDCHVHIFGPRERYPLAEDRTFAPGLASVEDLVAMHRSIGIDRVVLVQASPQGFDNRGVLDAAGELNALGHRARVVAVVPPGTSQQTLHGLHAAGVRGLRVNLQSYGQSDPQVARERMLAAASLAAPMGWHIQTYTTLTVIASLREAIAALPVPLVVDHFGLADPALGPDQPGWQALLELVAAGKVYVKLSAPYRLVDSLDGADGAWMARALVDANLQRMLWGSDWPHTGPFPGRARERDGVDPFHPVDNGDMLSMFGRWTREDERRPILVDNPARLYGFDVDG